MSESVNRQFKANFDHGFKTFHKATAGINKFKTKYYQKYVRKHQKGQFNRRRAKTVRNEQTAAQLLFEYTSLSTDKQVEYLPNFCIKLALKQANGDTKKEELALQFRRILGIFRAFFSPKYVRNMPKICRNMPEICRNYHFSTSA